MASPFTILMLRQHSGLEDVESPKVPRDSLIVTFPEPQIRYSTPDFTRPPSSDSKLGPEILLPNPPVPGNSTPKECTPRLSIRHSVDSPQPPSAPVTRPRHQKFQPRLPYLALVRLCLLCAHLSLGATVPYLLVKHLIQPMVLWLILVVCLLLQLIYLLPEIVLELVGIVRGRPIRSAWLQSGLHLTLTILALAPTCLALVLLNVAEQLPTCPNPWRYTPPLLPNFPLGLPGSSCQGLPKLLIMLLIDIVIVLLDISLVVIVIGVDYQKQKGKISAPVADSPAPPPRPQRRWTTGVGALLWDMYM